MSVSQQPAQNVDLIGHIGGSIYAVAVQEVFACQVLQLRGTIRCAKIPRANDRILCRQRVELRGGG
jgi:hypothetical protein